MEILNRLKAVLTDSDNTNKWLPEQLGKITCNYKQVLYEYYATYLIYFVLDFRFVTNKHA